MRRTDEPDPVLALIDLVIADITVGAGRFVAHRDEDGDAHSFVLQHDEAGRLRFARPDLGSPASVTTTARAVQSQLSRELGEPLPRCPLHPHALELVAVDGGYEWVCPTAQWRCGLGDYGEQTWPDLPGADLATLLVRRLARRGISGVRSFGIVEGENGPVATFAVGEPGPELVAALTAAAAPLQVEVHQTPRRPRRVAEPVARTTVGHGGAVRLVLSEVAVRRGDHLTYAVVNDGDAPVRLAHDYALDQQDDGEWHSIDTEAAFRLVGLTVPPGQRRDLRAWIPSRCVPGTYRLRKRIGPSARTGRPGPRRLLGELTAEFRVTDT